MRALSENVTAELEALKVALAEMRDDDLASPLAEAMAREISAIRLHLKRLRFEQQALGTEIERRALAG